MRRLAFIIILSFIAGVGTWAVLHYTAPKRQQLWGADYSSTPGRTRTEDELWAEGIEKVKADRGEPVGAVEVPTELRHYSDTHWFLATQVAEIRKYNIQNSQDFIDLATMIQRGEMIALPAATEEYVLYGVGKNADSDAFTRYVDGHSIGLYNEAQLREEYTRLETSDSKIESEIVSLKRQMGSIKKRDRKKQAKFQKQISDQEKDLKSTQESKALLDQFYRDADRRQRLFADYQSLQTLAKDFRGRSYDIDDPSDRQAMKAAMLRSLRPEALKIMKEVAAAYHEKFDRPLPVSSLVRPEEYQHALHSVNANAILIDTPPHSTGLAFDIDYRYMSPAEQSFLMSELARMKNEGRIEVLRERNANYHVFAFINGTRPSDELITASLDEAQASKSVNETHHATKKPEKTKGKTQRAKSGNSKPKGKPKAKRRR